MFRRNLEKRRHAIPDLGFHGLRSHINFLPQAEEWRLDQKVRPPQTGILYLDAMTDGLPEAFTSPGVPTTDR
jgi:hypothetical protein